LTNIPPSPRSAIMPLGRYRLLFAIAAAYDGIIGIAFLCTGPKIFDDAGVPQPNHWGYIYFASALLITFGIMFMAIAAAPLRNCNMIPFGALLKVCYVAVVGYYWLTTDVPMLFKPFAVVDAVMLVLFLWAYGTIRRFGFGPAVSAR